MTVSGDQQFGDILRRLRVAAGLSQEALAERAGLSARGISDLERGQRRVPHLATVRRLADALGLDAAARVELSQVGRSLPSAVATSPTSAALHRTPRSDTVPVRTTPLIGREREIAEITLLLQQPTTRLVTLTGPGGAGKTRLAVQIAGQVADMAVHDVCFVPLAPIADAELVVSAIADALGVREAGQATLPAAIIAGLRETPTLLVLDNFEHVTAAAPTVADLLSRCPNLTILATSRAALRLGEERLVDVAPLALPRPDAEPAAEDATRYGALALFVDRVRMLQGDFAVTSANITTITAICRRLDGLPLAIEMAAARMRVLSEQDLLALLEYRLPLLTVGARDLPVRHQTLRDTIAWSDELLSAAESQLFRRLAVFAGGWTFPAVAAIAADGGPTPRADLLDQLAVLVDHNLVRRVADAGTSARFEMLETIREFGLEQLALHDEADDTGRRHATYFRAFVEQQGFDRLVADEASRLARTDQEYDNVRAALRWFIDQRDAAASLSFCAALRQYWTVRGHLSEGRRWLEAAFALEDSTPGPARVRALHAAASIATHQGDFARVDRLAEECRRLGGHLGDERGVADGLHLLGLSAQLRDDYDRSATLYTECLEVKRRIAHPTLTATIGNLAQIAYHQGDVERSIALFDECIALDRERADISHLGIAMTDLGLIMLEQGDDQRAEEIFCEALTIHRDIGYVRMVTITIEGLAGLAGKQGQPERAARLYGAEEAISERIGNPRQDPNRWQYAHFVDLARGQLDAATFAGAWAVGRAMSVEDAIRYALEWRPAAIGSSDADHASK